VTVSRRPLPRPLADYAALLLAGTGLPPAGAARAAAGDPAVTVPPAAGSAVRAMRDGWAAASLAPPAAGPAPSPGPGEQEADGPEMGGPE
jgi:hypothetical protein